jgi:hypothetical protein
MSAEEAGPPPEVSRSLDRSLLRGLVGFEAFLYAAVALALAVRLIRRPETSAD